MISLKIDLDHGIPEHHINNITDASGLLKCLENHRLFGPYNMWFLPIVLTVVRQKNQGWISWIFGTQDDLVSKIQRYAKDSNKRRPPLTLGKLYKESSSKYRSKTENWEK